MNEKAVLKKSKDIVSRAVDEDLILVSLYKTDKDINYIYSLNRPAAKIWDSIDGRSTLGQIRERFLNYFKIDPGVFNSKFNEFIKDLKSIKAIE